MKIINTAPLSGMQELLPQEQVVFNRYKDAIKNVYRQYGFLEIETPTIDRSEVLFAKAGGETEKQIYKVVKTDETADDADQALRFDNTVPLARYVARYESDLNFPFRVTQIARNFRGERAQRGRFREFYQCDVDIIGRNSLAIEYDAEVIVTLARALDKLWSMLDGANRPSRQIRVSNRKILSGFLEELNLQEKATEILTFIDHVEKINPDKRKAWLDDLQIGEENATKLSDFINISGDASEVKQKLEVFGFQNEKFKEGVAELESVLNILAEQGLSDSVIGDMKIVRGLDYYTGTVFETIILERRELGSICSGGRYDNLSELYSKNKFPGVGGSIGLTRLFFILKEELNQVAVEKPIDFAIIPVTPNEREYCFKLAETYRTAEDVDRKGCSVDVILSDKKFSDRMKYAEKISTWGIVIGEGEANSNYVNEKNFKTGEIRPGLTNRL